MRVLWWDIKKKRPLNHDLTDAERQAATEVRQQNAAIRRKQTEIELAKLERDLLEIKADMDEFRGDDDYEDELTRSFFDIVKDKLLGGGGNPLSTTQPPTTPSMTSELSDTAIEEMINKIPGNVKKLALGMSDETLFSLLKSKTQYDDVTLTRIISRFRTQNI